VSEVRPTPVRYREAAGSDSGNEYLFVAKVACETLNTPAVFVTIYASKAPPSSRAMCVYAKDVGFYYIKATAVFGVSLVYQFHGENRVVLSSQRTYIGAVAKAKIARSAVEKKSDIDRMRAGALASSIVTPQSFLL
jgi:hypothetical protein